MPTEAALYTGGWPVSGEGTRLISVKPRCSARVGTRCIRPRIFPPLEPLVGSNSGLESPAGFARSLWVRYNTLSANGGGGARCVARARPRGFVSLSIGYIKVTPMVAILFTVY